DRHVLRVLPRRLSRRAHRRHGPAAVRQRPLAGRSLPRRRRLDRQRGDRPRAGAAHHRNVRPPVLARRGRRRYSGAVGAPPRRRHPEGGAGYDGARLRSHPGRGVRRQVRDHRRRSGDLSYAKLLEEWNDLLTRRPTFREPLAPYRLVLEAWAEWPAEPVTPLSWTASECAERWRRGVPLLSDVLVPILSENVEPLVAAALEFLAAVGEPEDVLRRFARAWDQGEVGPAAFFPSRGRVGLASLLTDFGLRAESTSFLAYGAFRPALDRYFAGCRIHLTEG